MTLIKYNPVNEFVPTSWNSILDNFFNDNPSRRNLSNFTPAVDIIENEGNYEIHISAPGMKKEDFNLEVKDHTLIISGERKWDNEESEKNFHRIESHYGSFKRSFTLPENINTEKIQASYVDGILAVQLPKDEKKALKTTIKVK